MPIELEKAQAELSDQSVEHILGYLLRTGVLLAAAIVLMGGFIYLRHNGAAMPGYHVFRGEPAPLRSIRGTIREAWTGEERSLIQFGILVLIATPVMRVLFSVYAFARQRDLTYVLITLVVLGLLLVGLLSR